MGTASRTPEGWPNHCPVCGADLIIEPSQPTADAPCPRCGHLLWFGPEAGEELHVIKVTGRWLRPDSLRELRDRVSGEVEPVIVLDFADVQFLASGSLAELIHLRRQVDLAKGRLRLRHLRPDLVEVFRITRLDRVFDFEA
jgi:anti-anti-sigma factor